MPPLLALGIATGVGAAAGTGGGIASGAAGKNTFRSSNFLDTKNYDPGRFEYGHDNWFTQAEKDRLGRERVRVDNREGTQLDSQAYGLARSAALGNAPSQAQNLLRNAQDDTLNSNMSMAGSVKGGAGARIAAMRGAMAQNSRMQAQGANSMAALRAQEMAQARGQYGAMAGQNAALEMQQRGLNDQRAMGYEGLRAHVNDAQQRSNIAQQEMGQRSHNQADNTNAAINQKNADNSAGAVKAVAGAFTGGASGVAGGLASDINTKMDVTPVGGPLSKLTGGAALPTILSDARAKEDARREGRIEGMHAGMRASLAQPPAVQAALDRSGGAAPASPVQAGPPEWLRGYMHDPATPPPRPQTLDQAMAASGAGADPYGRAIETPPERGVAGAPVGYAASREGQPGAMFGAPGGGQTASGVRGDAYAPDYRMAQAAQPDGDYDWSGYGQRRVAVSDDRAKLAAAWNQGHAAAVKDVTKLGGEGGEKLKKRDAPIAAAVRIAKANAYDEGAAKTHSADVYKRAAEANAAAEERERSADATRRGVDRVAAEAAGVVSPLGVQAVEDWADGRLGGRLGAAQEAATAAATAGPMSNANAVLDGARRVFRSDGESKHLGPEAAMASANRAMAPKEYVYRPEYTPPGQAPGERQVGPIAQTMAADKTARTAIVKDRDGMLGIDMDKGLKLTMGGLASLQKQVDDLKRRRGGR